MTSDRPSFPVYCAHYHFQHLLPAELCGEPLFVIEPSEELGAESCRAHLYKK